VHEVALEQVSSVFPLSTTIPLFFHITSHSTTRCVIALARGGGVSLDFGCTNHLLGLMWFKYRGDSSDTSVF